MSFSPKSLIMTSFDHNCVDHPVEPVQVCELGEDATPFLTRGACQQSDLRTVEDMASFLRNNQNKYQCRLVYVKSTAPLFFY